ncbi:isoaspartyl peptidase/L-asparaginase family protein [Shewanella sp. NIFS-20-20]|uniref:isoaspartyl peptidase/L-asparaginase family protein n=1 Tax=Shewanella sp. NIFS-20-20 TaxID=2853806 RepID=UPI001C4879AD|nr:isoaspartyl peptidase/L-asparaginase [Shewanella sp. NIFS-20-20]MBV7315089.1 isoaspartyl peptidase/L-asparaginase [Shewanella sp. NIFS-20-20]
MKFGHTMLATFALILPLSTSAVWAQGKPYAIAIHGGAGTIDKAAMSPEQQQAYRQTLTQAVNAGHEILAKGGDSLSAITAAIVILENSPLFNAGKGAVYTYDGGHELDAAIMDGHTMAAGAVAGVKHIANPIELARAVMQSSPHVLLSGAGAEEFALEQQFSLVPQSYFDTEARWQQWQQAKTKMQQDKAQARDYHASINQMILKDKFGTVGAVALDKHGNLAAGTSTGGMTAKRFGRVGDSPIIGAGTYAENGVCAVSATGHGEYFIRYQVAGDICARVKYQGTSIIQASDQVINQRLISAGGSGGVIAIDHRGNIATPFNTEGMYRATRKNDDAVQVMIWREQ